MLLVLMKNINITKPLFEKEEKYFNFNYRFQSAKILRKFWQNMYFILFSVLSDNKTQCKLQNFVFYEKKLVISLLNF